MQCFVLGAGVQGGACGWWMRTAMQGLEPYAIQCNAMHWRRCLKEELQHMMLQVLQLRAGEVDMALQRCCARRLAMSDMRVGAALNTIGTHNMRWLWRSDCQAKPSLYRMRVFAVNIDVNGGRGCGFAAHSFTRACLISRHKTRTS